MRKLTSLLAVLVLFIALANAQSRQISGQVTDDKGLPIPFASVTIKGTKKGVVADENGFFKLDAATGTVLVVSATGAETKQVTIGSDNSVAVALNKTGALEEVVVTTALGIKRDEKSLSYAAQTVKAKDLNLTQSVDVKGALVGKVAGVQLNGQAGSKLGETGKIRLRGAVSLTQDEDPLYVVDNVVVDPATIDMDNVESVNVLKGPNATALYGQRAQFGVIVMTLKKGTNSGVNVELNSTTTFESISRTLKYQNLYGVGYEGENTFDTFHYDPTFHPSYWAGLDGKTYVYGDNSYADESWGPKMDGREYLPWYAFWPGTSYFGKTTKFSPQPNNVKDFYNTGVTRKNTVSISGGNDMFSGRLSYTNLGQDGITPYTWLKRNYLNSTMTMKFSPKFKVDAVLNYTDGTVRGELDDQYSNQTSGSFNQWFNRNLEMDKMKELKDLQTPEGYHASWNWWGPDYYGDGGFFLRPAFWFNPYTYMERYNERVKSKNLMFSISPSYQILKNLTVSALFSRRYDERNASYYMPNYLGKNGSTGEGGYLGIQNGFGVSDRTFSEDNYDVRALYKTKFNDFDFNLIAGGAIIKQNSHRNSTQMNVFGNIGKLIVPDVWDFRNADILPTPVISNINKEVKSLYGNVSIGYKGFLYLDGSVRNDLTSALPDGNNSITTGSLGSSFVLSNLLPKSRILSYAKVRAGIAQIGSDLNAGATNPQFRVSEKPYKDAKGLYNVIGLLPTTFVDPDLKAAINTNMEFGVDLKFLNNRVSFSGTYYNEKRKDEIIPVTVPSSSGYTSLLTNSGTSKRQGVELSISGDVVKAENGFNWTTSLNFARNKTTVESIAEGLESIDGPGGSTAFGYVFVTHQVGKEWGQLRATTGYKRDAQGNKILNANGLYAVESNVYLGSILPKYTGGWYNAFSFKGFQLSAAIDFQKGGKFFSLSEQWGNSSGLLEPTAAINSNGKNVRDAVADGGGVFVTGVDATTGRSADQWVEAYDYFTQFHSNRLAEEYVHDASYIKLREVALSYSFNTKNILPNLKLKGINLGVVVRNPWLISVSKENYHKFDPSELAQAYGENGQLPGTRSIGVNVKLNF